MSLVDAGFRRRPPPPAPVPRDAPLGTFGLLRALRTNPLTSWTKLHYELPIVAGDTILGRLAVVSDPAAIRHVLVDNAANYRKDALQRRILAPGLGNGLLTAEDDEWRAQRRILAPLFTPRTVAGFAPAMQASANWLIARWRKQRPGRTLDIAKEMARMTLDVLERTIFSDGLARDPDSFARAVTRYFETIGRIDPLDVLNLPNWIPRLGRLRARPALNFFEGAVEAIIAARHRHLAEDPASVPKDLLTLLLEASDPDTGEGLSRVEVSANIVTFIGAGHETTANALTWSLFLISTEEGIREQLEAEVDRVLPDGHLADGSLDRLVLTRAVIEEAMRLYPPVASISREAIETDRLGPLRIRPGTTIVISPWVLHRHRRLWHLPDLFVPDRFLPGKREKIDRFAYLPFGAGPRVCIGAAFALQEATIVLASILRWFRLEMSPDHTVMPVQRVTTRPQGGLPMIIRNRRRN